MFDEEFWESKVVVWMEGDDIVGEVVLSHPEQVTTLIIQRRNTWISSTRPENPVFWWWDVNKRHKWLIDDIMEICANWYWRGWSDYID